MREGLTVRKDVKPAASAPVHESGRGEIQGVKNDGESDKVSEHGRRALMVKTDNDKDNGYVLVNDEIREDWVPVSIHTPSFS